MSITDVDYNLARKTRSIAATLRRLARWLATPPTADQSHALPKELEGAEDWLLDDLGLVETADGPRERARVTTKPEA